MSHDESPKLNEPHRFFHAMVLMGSALALGCGGISDRPADAGDDTHGSGGSGGSGAGGGAEPAGSGGSGPQAGMGGGVLSATGGATTVGMGFGGTSSPGNGGSSGSAAAGAPPTPDCPMAQWACDTDACTGDGQRYRIPNDCHCDDTRPKSADDCAPDQTFLCHVGDGAGTGPGEGPLPIFACTCVSRQSDCDDTCASVLGAQSRCLADTSGSDTILCGCAVVVLK